MLKVVLRILPFRFSWGCLVAAFSLSSPCSRCSVLSAVAGCGGSARAAGCAVLAAGGLVVRGAAVAGVVAPVGVSCSTRRLLRGALLARRPAVRRVRLPRRKRTGTAGARRLVSFLGGREEPIRSTIIAVPRNRPFRAAVRRARLLAARPAVRRVALSAVASSGPTFLPGSPRGLLFGFRVRRLFAC